MLPDPPRPSRQRPPPRVALAGLQHSCGRLDPLAEDQHHRPSPADGSLSRIAPPVSSPAFSSVAGVPSGGRRAPCRSRLEQWRRPRRGSSHVRCTPPKRRRRRIAATMQGPREDDGSRPRRRPVEVGLVGEKRRLRWRAAQGRDGGNRRRPGFRPPAPRFKIDRRGPAPLTSAASARPARPRGRARRACARFRLASRSSPAAESGARPKSRAPRIAPGSRRRRPRSRL